jgi:hypothetical protein
MRSLAAWPYRHRRIVLGLWLDRILPRVHVQAEDLSEIDEDTAPLTGTGPTAGRTG